MSEEEAKNIVDPVIISVPQNESPQSVRYELEQKFCIEKKSTAEQERTNVQQSEAARQNQKYKCDRGSGFLKDLAEKK